MHPDPAFRFLFFLGRTHSMTLNYALALIMSIDTRLKVSEVVYPDNDAVTNELGYNQYVDVGFLGLDNIPILLRST